VAVTSDDDKTPLDHLVDQAADLFVFAPIGLFFEGPSLLPKLAEQGRVHARNARLFGQFAVRHGEAELRRRVGEFEQQAEGVMRMVGLLPEDEPTSPERHEHAGAAGATSAEARMSGNGHAPPAAESPGPTVGELAIPGYDSLSASQVVTRLDGLTPAELEAVRSYESANRGRKTILNKVAQLQG
jgi:hypothetical protein